MTQVLTYKYRVLPNKRQHVALRQILDSQRQLYNAALSERLECYKKTGKTLTYFDQCKSVTQCRKEVEEMGSIPANIQRGPLEQAFNQKYHRDKFKVRQYHKRTKCGVMAGKSHPAPSHYYPTNALLA